jgi:hypothetical protein
MSAGMIPSQASSTSAGDVSSGKTRRPARNGSSIRLACGGKVVRPSGIQVSGSHSHREQHLKTRGAEPRTPEDRGPKGRMGCEAFHSPWTGTGVYGDEAGLEGQRGRTGSDLERSPRRTQVLKWGAPRRTEMQRNGNGKRFEPVTLRAAARVVRLYRAGELTGAEVTTYLRELAGLDAYAGPEDAAALWRLAGRDASPRRVWRMLPDLAEVA